jgi:hypothetical protein
MGAKMIMATRNSTARHIALAVLTLLFGLQAANPALAGPREQARRMHDRIAGVPPTEAVLAQMAADIQAGNPTAAANRALANRNFYNVTLKNFIAPRTNRDQSVFVPLNDYTATVIGMIRDDVDFSTVLSADLLYVANTSGAPAYSPANNGHYQYLEDNGVDLQASLQPQTQSGLLGLPVAATAGIMTTRAASQAFFVAGTNRAMFRFTLMNYLCRDLEQVLDTTRAPDRIRQDVSRSPGGDSRVFLNNCVGCHSGMDPLAQAFAFYNYNETTARVEYTPGVVQPKYLINSDNFKTGYVTTDDRWNNYWRAGQNSLMGWDSAMPGSGTGAKSMGQELARSDAFAQCQVEQVFKAMCFRDPADATDRARVQQIKNTFKSGGYRMKQVFAETAVHCMGQ